MEVKMENNKYDWLTEKRLDSIMKDLMYNYPLEYKDLTKDKVAAPEGWEDDLRADLMNRLPLGMYEIRNLDDKVIGWTGKGGQIEFEIAIQKEILRYL